MTEQQLVKWAPNSKPVAAIVVGWFNKYAEKYNVISDLRIAAFIAQVAHESGSFKYLREIASGQAYEGRISLGNTLPGDGKKFKGRGYIQITGRANYLSVSKAIFNDDTFINNPDLLSTPQYGMESALWFWNAKGLNTLADEQAFKTITKRINGGTNGFAERIHFYNTICTDLGLPIYCLPKI